MSQDDWSGGLEQRKLIGVIYKADGLAVLVGAASLAAQYHRKTCIDSKGGVRQPLMLCFA